MKAAPKQISGSRAYQYACEAVKGKVAAPYYVRSQCAEYKNVAEGYDSRFCISPKRLKKVSALLALMQLPKGLAAGKTLHDAAVGYQWLFWTAVLCTVWRDEPEKRRYENAILEIARKNFKTYTIAVLFLLLLLTEPAFSKLYSVAPDGSLSREVRNGIAEIIQSSPALRAQGVFRIRRDDIFCMLNQNDYIPLNYSNSRLDGRLPSAFLVDEAGALPNPYAIEAMRSGQLGILNKLGCIISTKYPTIDNPFEAEVAYAKQVLDGVIDDPKTFALLYEPDDKDNWTENDEIILHANPAAIEIPEIFEDVLAKRAAAIAKPKARQNFLTKHLNIIYQGSEAETYIPIETVRRCRREQIDWQGREVYVGVDLAMTNDNCAVAIAAAEDENILAEVYCFVPEGRIAEKNRLEGLDYWQFIRGGKCFACGDRTVDYAFIEDFVFELEEKLGVTVMGIAYDRFNALSSAQKWERGRDGSPGYTTVIVRQHSDTLHPPTKLLAEKAADGAFCYTDNPLLEINFQNARCVYDTNLNRYVSKKRSGGKIDMVAALINAVYLLQQNVYFADEIDWGVQIG